MLPNDPSSTKHVFGHVYSAERHIDIPSFDDSNVTVESNLGFGGGKHIVEQIFPYVPTPNYDHIAKFMLDKFRAFMPEVKIADYSLEHRKYVFAKEDPEFEGKFHTDNSEYTIIWYYRIDEGINGGDLLIADKYDTALSMYKNYHIVTPKEGLLVIFDGYHQVQKLWGEGERNIITIFINGSP